MTDEGAIDLMEIREWKEREIVELYRQGGWWREEWDSSLLKEMIRGSYTFIIAVDQSSGEAVGMGRVLSDGVSDAYIQDLVVHADHRGKGIGYRILQALVSACHRGNLSWICCIAEPGTEAFYHPLGFRVMERHTPMLLTGEDDHPVD